MKTLLVIDDQVSVRQTLSWLLESRGYRCLTAASPQEAETVYAENRVDAVIVDYGLAGINGLALAKRLKAVRPVPVLMLTGNMELKSVGKDVDVVLLKPQDPDELLSEIGRLTGPENAEK